MELAEHGYEPLDTGMTDRLFLHRRADPRLSFHLHLVERQTWEGRHERLMRDYLIAHPGLAAAYGELKTRLAQAHAEDRAAYTRAKTDFVRDVVARARAELRLPPIEVRPE